MKKLLYLLFAVTLFTACSSDDPVIPVQNNTSFLVTNSSSIDNLPNVIIGYKSGNNYKKLAELGDLKKDIPSKEIIVDDQNIKEIYIFTDYLSPRRVDFTFVLKQNLKNNIIILPGIKGIEVTDKTDSTQYPQ
jgi:hypothetical protein